MGRVSQSQVHHRYDLKTVRRTVFLTVFQIQQDFVQTNSKTSQKGGLAVGLPDWI